MTIVADGERMATLRKSAGRGARRVRPWWQPLALSAAAAAAVAALFNPIPAFANPGDVPGAPALPGVPAAVPDAGSRPTPLGTLVMPGQSATAPTTTTIATNATSSPAVAQIQKQRAEIDALGDQLIRLGQDRDLARQQATAADTNMSAAQAAVTAAQRDANTAAANSFRDAAALPPGALGTGLSDLDQLAQMQRGGAPTSEAAARQLTIAQAALTSAQAAQAAAAQRALDLSNQYDALNAQIASKQAALQQLEQANSGALSASDAAQSATDRALGAEYLAGALQGRGADPRAVAAVQYAIDQIGKWYEWAAEGPNTYDCSGLMWAAYHTAAAGDYPLTRVARDQFWQTRANIVDRYSLLPGDLLFFSYSNSWTGIHHVAMYAGNGKMVEAPRTGLQVRVTDVRWSSLFAATRVWGSVDGATQGPNLNVPPASSGGGSNPQPTPTPTPSATTTTTTRPSTPPPSSKPPSSGPPSSTPPTSASPSPSSTSTSPSPSGTSASPTGSTSSSASPSNSTSSSASDSPSAATSSSAASQAAATPSDCPTGSASASASPSPCPTDSPSTP